MNLFVVIGDKITWVMMLKLIKITSSGIYGFAAINQI